MDFIEEMKLRNEIAQMQNYEPSMYYYPTEKSGQQKRRERRAKERKKSDKKCK